MNTKKILKSGLIAVMIAIIFSTCNNGSTEGGDNEGTPENPVGTVYLGETLTLSGQVYDSIGGYGYFDETFLPYNGSHTVTAVTFVEGNFLGSLSIGGSGAITNGQLNYSIGKPDYLEILSFDDYLWYRYNIQASKNNVKGVLFSRLEFYVDEEKFHFYKQNYTSSVSGNTGWGLSEEVKYIYVEEDITVSGKGFTQTETDNDTYITKDFSLALKKGWNALYRMDEITYSEIIYDPYPSNLYHTDTTMFLSNPPLRWVRFVVGEGSKGSNPGGPIDGDNGDQ